MSDERRPPGRADEDGAAPPPRFYFDDLQDAEAVAGGGSDRVDRPDGVRPTDDASGDPDTGSSEELPAVVAAQLVDADDGADVPDPETTGPEGTAPVGTAPAGAAPVGAVPAGTSNAAGTWADTEDPPAPSGFGPNPDLDVAGSAPRQSPIPVPAGDAAPPSTTHTAGSKRRVVFDDDAFDDDALDDGAAGTGGAGRTGPPGNAADPAGDDGEPRRRRLVRAAAAALGILVVVGAGTLVRHLAAGPGNDHRGRIVAVPTPTTTARHAGPRPSTSRRLPHSRVPRRTRTPAAVRRTAKTGVRPKSNSTPSPARASARRSRTPPPKVPVTVLNNTTVTGLASAAAQRLHARGWPVSDVSNYTGRVPATTVFYDAGVPSEARAAKSLAAQFPAIESAQPRFAGLPGSGLTVVLAPNWAG